MTQDIFVPTSKPGDALVGPLHTVTFLTRDTEAFERVFSEGYCLDGSGWEDATDTQRASLNGYLGLQAEHDWSTCAYTKSGAGSNLQIRVLALREDTPAVRGAYDGLYVGGATLSFPIADLHAHEKRMAGLGVESTMGVKELAFESPTGETYVSAEIVYKAPDNVFLMGVKRPDVFVPVGPMDADLGLGGPAYSARCVAAADATVDFFRDVLGYEIRRDMVLQVDGPSAINLPRGTEERFVQAFAPGAATGYVIFMAHGAATKRAGDNLGPPNRGIVMWTFPTTDLDEVYRRASAARDVDVLHPPAKRHSPFLPETHTLLLKDPDGFPIEVFEKA